MNTQRTLSMPLAVLISGVLIAVAVFFGLRSRPLPAGNPLAPASTLAPGSPGDIAAHGTPSPPAPVSTEVVAVQLTEALDAQRKDLVKRCWTGNPSVKAVKLHVNVSFNAGGQQIIRGLREDRATPLPNIRQCVSDAMQPLQIPPPGAPVFVEVPFTLP